MTAQPEPRYTATEIRLIGDDGRSHVHRFDVLVPPNTAPDAVPEAVTGWRYVMDANGNDLPFTADNLAILFDNYPHAAPAISLASMR